LSFESNKVGLIHLYSRESQTKLYFYRLRVQKYFIENFTSKITQVAIPIR